MYILYYRTHADGKYDGRSVVTPLSPRSLTKCRGIATHARFEETLKRLKRSYALSLHERVPYRATTRRAGRVIALLIACYFHRASPHVRRSGCPFPPPYQPENITRARARTHRNNVITRFRCTWREGMSERRTCTITIHHPIDLVAFLRLVYKLVFRKWFTCPRAVTRTSALGNVYKSLYEKHEYSSTDDGVRQTNAFYGI